MAAVGAGGASGGGEKEPRLPEVQMKWKDFMWSLEKLRHKHYDKSMRERYRYTSKQESMDRPRWCPRFLKVDRLVNTFGAVFITL